MITIIKQYKTVLTFITMMLLSVMRADASEAALIGNPAVLIVISSDSHGYWLPEVLEPYRILKRAGFDVDIASPAGGEGIIGGRFQLSAKQKSWFETSALKVKLAQSIKLSNIDGKDYQAVYYAGGAGPMFDLVDNQDSHKIINAVINHGGIVAADCHGPVALLNVRLRNGERLIKNKRITAKANSEEGRWARATYPFLLQDKIIELGGLYVEQAKGEVNVVVDGQLVTGQNPISAIPVINSLIPILTEQYPLKLTVLTPE